MTNITDKVFVLTGTLSCSRKEVTGLIEEAGGIVKSGITKDTNYLVAGENAGSKLDKAKSLNIPVLDEHTFFELLGLSHDDFNEDDDGWNDDEEDSAITKK